MFYIKETKKLDTSTSAPTILVNKAGTTQDRLAKIETVISFTL